MLFVNIGLQNFLSGRKVNIMGIEQLKAWVSAEKQKEAQARDNERNAALLEERKRLNRLARVKADANYLQHSEVYGAFKECAQALRGRWNDVTLRIIKAKHDKDKPRIELTWNYEYHRAEHSSSADFWSCDLISAEVDERNPKTQEVVGIKFFQDEVGTYSLGVCVPDRDKLIETLEKGIKDPLRRKESFVKQPSLFKRIVAPFS